MAFLLSVIYFVVFVIIIKSFHVSEHRLLHVCCMYLQYLSEMPLNNNSVSLVLYGFFGDIMVFQIIITAMPIVHGKEVDPVEGREVYRILRSIGI